MRRAIDVMRKKDIFEKVLGKEMRRAGLEYHSYVRIISEIRELAQSERLDLVRAAEAYLSQQK
ncbi:MAG TPA: hypothetical protein VGK23_11135 [Methanomassiliicoccales archaeon]